MRRNTRYIALSDIIDTPDKESDELLLNTFFIQDDSWHKDTRSTAFDNSWKSLDNQAENDIFWQVLDLRLNNLHHLTCPKTAIVTMSQA